MSPGRSEAPLQVGEEAARWLVLLQESEARHRADFFVWLRQSPRHVEEFLFATATWRQLNLFGKAYAQRVEELLREASLEQADSSVIAFSGAAVLRPERRLRPRVAAIAAGVAIFAIALVAWRLLPTNESIYSTRAGEQRIVQLDDGSVAHLNTRSRLEVRFSKQAREIRLLEGEALFTVRQDASRPFRVDAGSGTVQAIGTEFAVYRRSAGMTVSVLQGSVRVSAKASEGGAGPAVRAPAPTVLVAGEQLELLSGGRMTRRKPVDPLESVAWREHRLVFRAARLEEIAAEVSRYGTRPIRVEGAARDMRLSAIFDAGDADSLVRFLGKLEGLEVESRADEIVVSGAGEMRRPRLP